MPFNQCRQPLSTSKRSNSVGRLGIHNGTRSSRTRCRPKCFLPRSPAACVDSARDSSRWAQQKSAHFGPTSSRHLRVLKRGLNANTSIRHTEPEGAIALRSEGLPQVAYADHKRYGCDFNWQQDQALKTNDHDRLRETAIRAYSSWHVGRKRISFVSTSSGWLIRIGNAVTTIASSFIPSSRFSNSWVETRPMSQRLHSLSAFQRPTNFCSSSG